MMTRSLLALRIAALAALFGFANVQSLPAALTLEKQDRICIIGSGLADRMQHDGWLETVLHTAYPKHYLTSQTGPRQLSLPIKHDLLDY